MRSRLYIEIVTGKRGKSLVDSLIKIAQGRYPLPPLPEPPPPPKEYPPLQPRKVDPSKQKRYVEEPDIRSRLLQKGITTTLSLEELRRLNHKPEERQFPNLVPHEERKALFAEFNDPAKIREAYFQPGQEIMFPHNLQELYEKTRSPYTKPINLFGNPQDKRNIYMSDYAFYRYFLGSDKSEEPEYDFAELWAIYPWLRNYALIHPLALEPIPWDIPWGAHLPQSPYYQDSPWVRLGKEIQEELREELKKFYKKPTYIRPAMKPEPTTFFYGRLASPHFDYLLRYILGDKIRKSEEVEKLVNDQRFQELVRNPALFKLYVDEIASEPVFKFRKEIYSKLPKEYQDYYHNRAKQLANDLVNDYSDESDKKLNTYREFDPDKEGFRKITSPDVKMKRRARIPSIPSPSDR